MTDRIQRRLAAILAADVVGYSRLMGEDEAGTLRALRRLRTELFAPAVDRHRGEVVKSMGDGWLVEFASVADAVICAIDVQERLAEQDSMKLRVGLHLGDIAHEEEDIFGDGVNIAARLQDIAEPGGIVISDVARRSIDGRLAASFVDLGVQNLKNIAVPITAYGWGMTAITVDANALPLPDKPSIAVLPFTNMSGDPEQEFFSDGITEDIITALSKISNLFVIARNSTFTYKGHAVDVKQVCHEQGVRYVLEGSVRKAGNRVRVTAQLIDATAGHHLWAERYDRDLEDIFATQDEITREVVIALDVRLTGGEQARVWSGGTKNLEAWECVRLAVHLLNRGTHEGPREIQRLCRRALKIDPNYAMAWVTLGWAHHHGVDVGLGHASNEKREAELESGLDCGKKALELAPLFGDAYSLLSMCHLSKSEYDLALTMSERAISLAPSHADLLALSAMLQNKSGRPQRSIERIKKAMRLCPIYPGWYLSVLGMAYRLTDQTDAAIDAFEGGIRRDADFLALHVGLASILGEVGRQEDAKKSASEVQRLAPDFSIKKYMDGLSYRDPAVTARFANGLHKAGLPE